MSPSPSQPSAGVEAGADVRGPCVTEFGSGICVGTAGRNGVVVLGAGGSESGVPSCEGDLESSGIHRIDLERMAGSDTPAADLPEGASIWVAGPGA